jgi:hypothetical protein
VQLLGRIPSCSLPAESSSVPGVHIDTIDVSLPPSDFDTSAKVVKVTVYCLDALMAYELGLLWLALDTQVMPDFPATDRHLRASVNIFNLLLMHDLRAANPQEPLLDLRYFAAYVQHVAEETAGPGGYRAMHAWVLNRFGKPAKREDLARVPVNGWKIWPSLHSEKLRDTERAFNLAAVQAHLCDTFKLIYDLVSLPLPG